MVKKLSGSRTEENLRTAFAGEARARCHYDYFASVAKKEGYQQIAGIFAGTALNEKEHAKLWAKFLGEIGDTEANLRAAAAGERYEWSEMYKEFEETAREEGFDNIADFFHKVAEVEREHEKRFLSLLGNLQEGQVFKRDEVVKWRCRNCGYFHRDREAPQVCPACAHPQSFFELAAENY